MPNTYDLDGKRAIVTGAAKGIGRAIAQRLHASGAAVWIWDRSPVAVAGMRASVVDVARRDEIDACLEAEPSEARIDMLVSAAGYLGRAQPFESHARADWERIVDVNLKGTLNVVQAIVPRMRRQGGGRVVTFGSLAGKEGLAEIAAYSAASGGVIAFTKAIAREVAADGVFVNCVAPGPVDTDMIRDLGAPVVERMVADSPMKRLGTADEVAHLVAWLCSDASRFNTGAVFDMSGGRARY